MVLRISSNPNLTSVSQNLLALGDRRLGVVCAFGVNCGPKHFQNPGHIGFIEYHHMIHAPKRRHKRNALILIQDWAARTFKRPNRSVAVDGDHEHVPESTCTLEVSHVSHMKNIEAPICQNCSLA